MKIDLNLADKAPILTKIKGDETWLAEIYKLFPVPGKNEHPILSATVEIKKIGEEMFQLTGQLGYSPFVPCSRCDLSIPWTINHSFSPIIIPEGSEWADDGASDEIYYHSDLSFDLELLLNDQVQLAIPQQTVVRTDDGEHCANCNLNIGTDKVFSSKDDGKAEESPFSVLKGLKLN